MSDTFDHEQEAFERLENGEVDTPGKIIEDSGSQSCREVEDEDDEDNKFEYREYEEDENEIEFEDEVKL